MVHCRAPNCTGNSARVSPPRENPPRASNPLHCIAHCAKHCSLQLMTVHRAVNRRRRKRIPQDIDDKRDVRPHSKYNTQEWSVLCILHLHYTWGCAAQHLRIHFNDGMEATLQIRHSKIIDSAFYYFTEHCKTCDLRQQGKYNTWEWELLHRWVCTACNKRDVRAHWL